MKRIGLFLLCLIGVVGIMTAQDNEVKLVRVDTVVPVQDLCKAIPTSHWSFSVKGGGNFYRMPPDAVNEMDRLNLSLGGGLEYTINPLVGLGIEYLFSDYSRPYTYAGSLGDIKGSTSDILLVGSFNLSNALAPNRKGFWQYVSLMGDVGGGAAFFECVDNGAVTSKDSPAMMAKLGLSLEFVLGDRLNLNLGGEYRQYDALFMTNGLSNRNCDGYMATLGLRYKFGSKEKKHARDVRMCQMSPNPEPVIITKTYRNEDTDATLAKLKKVQAEQAALKQKLQKMQEEAAKPAR